MKKTIEQYMTTMDIKEAAWKISIPMVISMISIALYGIIDTIFVSNLGENALNAISLAYPIQNIITAIALGIGIGLNVIISKSLGEKDEEKAKKVITSGFTLTIIAWILVAVFGIFGTGPFFEFFLKNIENKELYKYGYSYLSIISIFSIGTLMQILIEKILEAYGKTTESMILQISGAIINLILDPILIYGINNFQGLGIKGAAIATVIGQIIGMIIGIIFIFKNNIINLSIFREFKLDLNVTKSILMVGIPTMLMEMLSSFISLILNKILIDISDMAVAVWGIYVKVEKFIFIIIYGFNYGMMPMLGYCLGAKQEEKVNKIIKYFYKISLTIGIVGAVIFIVLPSQIIGWFGVSQETLQIGVTAFRILALGFIFQATSLVLSATFQTYEKASYSLIISLFRKAFIVIPTILLFKNTYGLNIVWWAFTMAEIITAGVAVMLYTKKIRAKYMI